MKKLGVAGDSFMSALQDLDRPDCLANSHFTELLAKEFKMEYHTLARGGASNYCISHQVKQLIRDEVDVILIGFTGTERDEIVIGDIDNSFSIFDFNYYGYPDLSAKDPRFKKEPSVVTDSLPDLLVPVGEKNSMYFINSQEKVSAKLTKNNRYLLNSYINYFKSLHNSVYKCQKDIDIMISTIAQLESSKIPYLFYTNTPHSWLDSKVENITLDFDSNPINYFFPERDGNLRYHTTPEQQITIKNAWAPYIQKIFQKISPSI